MSFRIPSISLRVLFNTRVMASVYLIIMCVQIVAIEGYGVSPLKVGLMALAPLVFLLKTPYISKALLLGALYWLICYFSATFNGDMRFSTIGYLGMFIVTFITYYNLIHSGAFSLQYFIKLLRAIIIAFGITLLMQQICILVGIRSLFFINLDNQFFLSLTKLPVWCIEPSHTARVLAFLMLAYWRCLQVQNQGEKITLPLLFSIEHRWVSISFLWVMLTMGSGTAFIALGVLSLYFIEKRTIVYVLPLLVGLFFLGQRMELEQMNRALLVSKAVTTGDTKEIVEADGSAAVRILPLVNTLTKLDLSDRDTWFGKGTVSLQQRAQWARNIGSAKMGNIDQYGLLSYLVVLCIIFSCCIYRFLSLETLLSFILIGLTMNNFAYIWGCYFILLAVRYFRNNSLIYDGENNK